MQIEFNAKKRDAQGTGASRRLRHAGRVPGIVYGGDAKPQAIELDHNELFQHLRKEAFYSSVLTINLEGAKQMCLLRDVQRHAYRPLILHVDFQRIDEAHKIHQKVPLHFINADVAPGVKEQGGMVQHVTTELDVRCLPKDLPSFIEVDLKDLTGTRSMHASEITLPAGVEIVLHRGEDPVVATIVILGAGAAEEEVVEVAPVETQITTEKKPVEKGEKTEKPEKPEKK
jgi:large subunit ribosomal protein L25